MNSLVVVGEKRAPELPNVPTLAEAGCTPFDGGTTAGVLARVETSKPILTILNASVVTALKDPAIAAKLVELGAVPRPSTMEEFAAYMKDQEAGVSALVKSGLLKPE